VEGAEGVCCHEVSIGREYNVRRITKRAILEVDGDERTVSDVIPLLPATLLVDRKRKATSCKCVCCIMWPESLYLPCLMRLRVSLESLLRNLSEDPVADHLVPILYRAYIAGKLQLHCDGSD
jgi:hypothetical protein